MKKELLVSLGLLALAAGLWFGDGLFNKENAVSTVTINEVKTAISNNTTTTTNATVSPQSTYKKTVYNLNLTSANTVLLLGEVGASSMAISQELQQKAKKNKVVYLLIDSPGGSVLEGMTIVTAVQNSKTPIYTVCISACASMAAIIFEFGKERFMVDRSILMFHEASLGGLSGQINQVKTRLAFFDSMINKLDYEIAVRVGIDPRVFMNALPSEVWMDSEDAVKTNFADKLASVTLDIYSNNSNMTSLISKVNPLKDKITINVR